VQVAVVRLTGALGRVDQGDRSFVGFERARVDHRLDRGRAGLFKRLLGMRHVQIVGEDHVAVDDQA
jgi:hypothetical protein